MSDKHERNFFLFKVLDRFFFALSFPTYVLFLKDGGMKPSEIGIINTMFLLAVVLFEIPTGIVGDRFGRKRSIIIGLFVCSFGHLWYFSSHSLWMYSTAEMIIALGVSFISGSLQAWLHDSIAHHNGKNKFGVVWSNGEKFAHLASVVGGFIGALLASIYLPLPWLVACLGILGLAILCFWLVDESYFVHEKLGWKENWQKTIQIFKAGFSLSWNKKELRYFYIITCLTLFALQPMNQQWSLYFEKEFGIGSILLIWLGVSFSLFLGSHTVSCLLKKDNSSEVTLLFIVQLLTSVLVLLMAQQISPLLVVFFFCFHEIPRGSWSSLSESYLQKQIPSAIRATMGSITSVVTRLGAGAGWFLSGLLLERVPILNCWFFSGICLLLTLPFFFLLRKSTRVSNGYVQV
ncbi:MAG: High-affinity glucose transporter SNF3 [Parcubacteria group bacterium GW2011_GWC2_39_14]|nr:MAG: High-affinity glucose transporter SNF3 [Parcubacteria group bacterium GW2011_GWC2_39_14]KKR54333.1 MAG: High-affinity glucose transporter SNF3 [Parcubacteria group bacterium GW2011_GWA2_40_23]